MGLIDGKELLVTPASFLDAMALKGVITKALKRGGFKVDLSSVDIDFKNLDLENIESVKVGDIGWIFEHVLTLSTDSDVRTHLFKCAERALFNKNKVDADLFEDVENRKYYYPIMMEVLKVNILPFFGLASSVFSKLGALKDKFLKSKSQPQK